MDVDLPSDEPLPRVVRMRPWGRVRLVAVVASIVLLLCLVFPVGVRPWGEPLAWRFGQTVTGEVTGKRVVARQRVKRIRPRFRRYVAYRYHTPAGREAHREERVATRALYDAAEAGAPVEVRVLSLGPLRAASIEHDDWLNVMMTVSSVYWLVVARQFHWLCRWRVRRILLTHGDTAVGRVVHTRQSLFAKPSNRTYVVRYEYDTPAGTRRGRCVLLDLFVRPGDDVSVFYDPRRPGRSVAYVAADYSVLPEGPVTYSPAGIARVVVRDAI